MLNLKLKKYKSIILSLQIFLCFFGFNFAWAQSKNVTVFLSPRNGTFLTGGAVEVGVYIDTMGESINAVDLRLDFDPKKMAIVKPSGGQSVIGIWVEPPVYDNSKGTFTLSGVVPEGLVTNSGLITTLSFKVLTPGPANISINSKTNVYKNDGLGTKLKVQGGFANFVFNNAPQEGVLVQSETHPFSENWYNNKNPILSWLDNKSANAYSFELDTNPYTIPKNEVLTTNTVTSFDDLADGIWYFHVKAKEAFGWGNTSHYQIKIDSTPPNPFKPVVSLMDGLGNRQHMVTFSTTDNSSGIDHYEIGIIDEDKAQTAMPAFVQVESPYILPDSVNSGTRIIVKAFDRAGNVSEGYTILYPNRTKSLIYILIGVIVLLILTHYLFGHQFLRKFKQAYRIVNNQNSPNNFSEPLISQATASRLNKNINTVPIISPNINVPKTYEAVINPTDQVGPTRNGSVLPKNTNEQLSSVESIVGNIDYKILPKIDPNAPIQKSLDLNSLGEIKPRPISANKGLIDSL